MPQTVEATVRMRFEYDEDSFDEEITEERVKDETQDTILAHPDILWDMISVSNPDDEELTPKEKSRKDLEMIRSLSDGALKAFQSGDLDHAIETLESINEIGEDWHDPDIDYFNRFNLAVPEE